MISCELHPGIEFLDRLSQQIAAEILSILDVVSNAPPPAFSGGGKWEAMHGPMSGIYEIRVQGGGQNHRLFCILDRKAEDLGGPSIVVIGGLSKPKRTAAKPRDYAAIVGFRDEFFTRRTVVE
jgi:Txe/YoeB family toxin of Txe-Axe toxin-antitoxin module